MFSQDFFPTPFDTIEEMCASLEVRGKIFLEPEAGRGDIVDYLLKNGAAEVIACENHPELKKIVASKCRLIADDFLTVTPEMISHIDYIVMNPPFSADEKHIVHAWNIAPAGCFISALCNLATVENAYTRCRRELVSIINQYGSYLNLGDCFSKADRKTGVEIAWVRLQKPGATNYDAEFGGFFMEEEVELQSYGIMPYNAIRDLVNRYITAVKIFDEQLKTAERLHDITDGFFTGKIGMRVTKGDMPVTRNDFKKDLQKAAWQWVFQKMNMQKYTTKGLKEDINKFVEQQTAVPFTMRNIYRMIEIVAGTHAQRMDKALLEVSDRLTKHYHENRYNVEGWKTNSHYMINEKFILPYMTRVEFGGNMSVTYQEANTEMMDDMQKALCYITGTDYDKMESIWSFFHKNITTEGHRTEYMRYEFNTWYDWGFFQLKGFKKGTMHFRFKDLDVWAKLNQNIARICGNPLFEGVKKAA